MVKPKLLGNIKPRISISGVVTNFLELDMCWENDEALKDLSDKRVEVSLKEYGNKRKDCQNRYYWAGVLPSAMKCLNHNGHLFLDVDEVHQFFLMAFHSKIIIWNGREIRIPKSSTSMKIKTFYEYIMKIVSFILDNFNWAIPEPRERII